MGWWRINEDGGGIDWSSRGNSGLINADPRFGDTQENYYNGDEPADAMGDAITGVMEYFGIPYESETKVPYDEIKALFFEQKFIGFFADKPQVGILEIVSKVWSDVDKIYLRVWKRLPYPEEKQAAFDFTVSAYTPEEQNDQA